MELQCYNPKTGQLVTKDHRTVKKMRKLYKGKLVRKVQRYLKQTSCNASVPLRKSLKQVKQYRFRVENVQHVYQGVQVAGRSV